LDKFFKDFTAFTLSDIHAKKLNSFMDLHANHSCQLQSLALPNLALTPMVYHAHAIHSAAE
jgi:hypothetical protein